jgi:hypothetical protein
MSIRANSRELRRISFVSPAEMQLYSMGRTPVFRRTVAAMRLFYGHEAFMPGRGRGVIVFAAPRRRCRANRESSPGRGQTTGLGAEPRKSADGQCYNPTLSCIKPNFMLFRMNRG